PFAISDDDEDTSWVADNGEATQYVDGIPLDDPFYTQEPTSYNLRTPTFLSPQQTGSVMTPPKSTDNVPILDRRPHSRRASALSAHFDVPPAGISKAASNTLNEQEEDDTESFVDEDVLDDDEDRDDRGVKYENFTTIDWMRDFIRDQRYLHRGRHRQARHSGGFMSFLHTAFEISESWLLTSLVGISIGLVAGWIDVVAAWLTDIRVGFCRTEWYVSRTICCMSVGTASAHELGCEDWTDWSGGIFGRSDIYIIDMLFYVLFSVLFASVCAFLVVQLAPYAAGSGSAEIKTILGGFIIKGFLGVRTLVVKSVGLPLMVASGLAVGKEGPMIHVASCVGNIFPRLFPKYWRNEARKREILSAAGGAGIAVAFGAPIGGVLFSLEELSSFFPIKTMVRVFFCALVSTVTLQVINPYRGKRVLYQVTYDRDWHFFEMILFVVIGIFGGLSGALLIRLNMRIQSLRRTHAWFKALDPVKEVAAVACLTAVICWFNIFTRVDASELLEHLFKECKESDFHGLCDVESRGKVFASLVMALIVRLGLTIVTFGVKVPAGIFIPSMVWGALFGRALGIAVAAWQHAQPKFILFASCHPDIPCVTPGMYSLLGAIGALGGVTRLTVSLTVIMFELTGTLSYIIPCMATLMVAKLVGDFFSGGGGMAEHLIKFNHYPFLDPREGEDLGVFLGLRAGEVMTPVGAAADTGTGVVCFTAKGMCVRDLEGALHGLRFKGFPVIDRVEDRNLVGYISREDLKYALEKAKFAHPLPPNTPVSFDSRLSRRYSAGGSTRRGSAPTRQQSGVDELNSIADDPGGWVELDLTGHLDRTPLGVHPLVPVEFVMDLFTKLGPRYVLVTHNGKLEGIITKKDLLVALQAAEHEAGGG
ncbi:glycerol ethanol, ferric requiring protein, partial [Borealophlyctis nickersoniae]